MPGDSVDDLFPERFATAQKWKRLRVANWCRVDDGAVVNVELYLFSKFQRQYTEVTQTVLN